MLLSLRQLLGYDLHAVDGEIGKVDDFLFDDLKWNIRYLVADTGNWLIDRQVLISPAVLGDTDWKVKEVKVDLTKEKIEDSPKIDNDLPVSRQYEKRLVDYYGWPHYWKGVGIGLEAPVPPIKLPQAEKSIEEEEGDPHLRSVNEVINYDIRAVDGDIGHVEDFIVDATSWLLQYIVVDTRKFLPGKKVIFAIEWIRKIQFQKSAVEVDLTEESVKNSPLYDPSAPVNREFEERLYDYYGRPKYWK
jgi:hypothetical protein